MYKIGNQYLYCLRTLVTFTGESGNYYIFKSDTTEFRISKFGESNIKVPFKYISF